MPLRFPSIHFTSMLEEMRYFGFENGFKVHKGLFTCVTKFNAEKKGTENGKLVRLANLLSGMRISASSFGTHSFHRSSKMFNCCIPQDDSELQIACIKENNVEDITPDVLVTAYEMEGGGLDEANEYADRHLQLIIIGGISDWCSQDEGQRKRELASRNCAKMWEFMIDNVSHA